MRFAFCLLMFTAVGCFGKRMSDDDKGGDQVITASAGTTIHTETPNVTLIRCVNEGAEVRFDLLVWTEDLSKSYEFEAWSDHLNYVPPMTDELGSSYNAINGRRDHLGTTPSQFARKFLATRGNETLKTVRDRSGKITSTQACADSVRFHSPTPKAEKLTIVLPGAAIGSRSPIRFSVKTAELEKGFSLP